jgi:hypothetical protein
VEPVKKIKIGGIEAAVWQNKSSEGKEFYNVTMERSYKDGEEWKKTNSLRVNDLPKAILALQKAYEFTAIKEE